MPWQDREFSQYTKIWQCNMCKRSIEFTITKHDRIIYYNCASCGYNVDRLDLGLEAYE